MINTPESMSIEELATILKVSNLSVQRWISSGQLKAEKMKRENVKKWIITRENFINYLRRQQ